MSEFSLPEGWVETPLGEYLYLKNGYAFKSNSYIEKNDDTVPVIRISDIDGKIANDETAIHVKKADVVDGFEIKNGDLLIAMSGATTGKVGVYKGSEPAYQNQRVGNLKLHSNGHGSPKYKNHLIASLTPDILKIAYGGAQPNISGKAIEDLLVALPPLAEQQQIAQKLDELLAQVGTLKTRLDAIPKILKRFRQSVLAAAVSGRLTKSSQAHWHTEKIENLVSIVNGKAFPSGDYQEFGVRLLRPGNLHMSGQVIWNEKNTTYIPESWKRKRPELVLNDGALLMNLTAQSLADEFLGRVCTFKMAEETVLLNQRICSFISKTDYDIKPYLYIYFKSPQFREYVDTLDSGTLIKHLNIKDIKAYPISLPPVEEQAEIVRLVEQFFAHADQIEQRVKDAQARVNHLTQSILAKAFRGELTAEWRAQNPELISGENSAAVLLERIKVEREARVKPKRKEKYISA